MKITSQPFVLRAINSKSPYTPLRYVKAMVLLAFMVFGLHTGFANGMLIDKEHATIASGVEIADLYGSGQAMAPNDAAIISIDSPKSFCPGLHPIIVTLQNAGTNQLTSATINWTLNGIPMNPTAWTGNLDPVGGPGPNTTQVTVGMFNFTPGSNFTFRAWSTMPNGVADSDNTNDTSQVVRRAGISGVFTIGGTSPDFNTIQDAVNEVETEGLCGSVVFNIRSGTYNEQISIGHIEGTSANYTVTFQSETGNKADVTITYAASPASNYTLELNGCSHVIFQDLTFEATGTSYRRVVSVMGNSSNCTFVDNDIVATNAFTSSTAYASVFSSGDNNNDFEFRNNNIRGGSYGIYWYGSSTSSPESGSIFEGNIIEPYYRGMQLYYQDSAKVHRNTITSNTFTAYNSFYGIHTSNLGNGSHITANQIDCATGSYGMFLSDLTGSAGNPALVANNFIHVGGTSTAYGIYLTGSIGVADIVYNSVNITSTSSFGGRAIYKTASATDLRLYNNNLVNSDAGYAAYFSNTGGLTANRNNYYSTGANLINYNNDYSVLSVYQAASGQDANSVSWDPMFVSSTDLHTSAGGLNGQAMPLSSVGEDIDGDPRHATLPDIGADEFTPPPVDMAVVHIISPVTGCGLSDIEEVKVALQNFGGQPLNVGQTFDVYFQVEQQPIVSETITIAQQVDPVDTFHYVFSSLADLSESGQYDVVVWLAISGDANNENDTLSGLVHNSLILEYPYLEDFEEWAPQSASGSCGTQDGVALFGWENDLLDDGVWNVYSGSTPTGSTGPQVDYRPGHTNGQYLYVESSGCSNSTLSLISPCFDMAGINNPGMNLAYHMYGSDIGSLNIDIIMEAGTEFTGIWRVNGEQGNQWNLAVIDLSTFAALGTFRIRMRAVTSGLYGDIAIDDIRVGSLPEAKISADTIRDCGFALVSGNVVTGANYLWSNGVTEPSFEMTNFGSSTITEHLSLRVTKGGLYSLDSVLVILEKGPVIGLQDHVLLCDEDSLVLDAGNPGALHQWDNGTFNRQRTVNSDGVYWVKVDNLQGCIKYDTTEVDFDVTPVADFVYQNVSSRSFIDFGLGNSQGESYLWDFGDGNGATVAEPSHYYTSGGPYTVTLIVSSDCGSDTTSQVIEVWPTGVDDPEAVREARVFPNPAKDQVHVQIQSTKQIQWTVQLMNLQGQVLEVRQLPTGKNVSGELWVQDIPAGYYLIEMRSELGKIVRPLVVQ